MKNSVSEENYLKAIYGLSNHGKGASTNALAEKLSTKASSVSDMVKKLATKKLVNYKKYQGVTLTKQGEKIAVKIIRKHRLWEVFLVNKLQFKWDEVHEIAEQLEHIRSVELTNRLDKFLDFPKTDPHGDPIPDANGKVKTVALQVALSQLKSRENGVIVGVNDTGREFLKYLESQGLMLGKKVEVLKVHNYDLSMELKLENGRITISELVSKNIMVNKG